MISWKSKRVNFDTDIITLFDDDRWSSIITVAFLQRPNNPPNQLELDLASSGLKPIPIDSLLGAGGGLGFEALALAGFGAGAGAGATSSASTCSLANLLHTAGFTPDRFTFSGLWFWLSFSRLWFGCGLCRRFRRLRDWGRLRLFRTGIVGGTHIHTFHSSHTLFRLCFLWLRLLGFSFFRLCPCWLWRLWIWAGGFCLSLRWLGLFCLSLFWLRFLRGGLCWLWFRWFGFCWLWRFWFWFWGGRTATAGYSNFVSKLGANSLRGSNGSQTRRLKCNDQAARGRVLPDRPDNNPERSAPPARP